jgi:hypothetical protein
VAIWRITVGVERGCSGGAVLELAKNVDTTKLAGKSSRLAGFLADVGRGLARERRTRAEAVRWLRQSRSGGPATGPKINGEPQVTRCVAS